MFSASNNIVNFVKFVYAGLPQKTRQVKCGKMSVTLVHIRVKPDKIEEFIAATLRNQTASRREEGNLRFDFLQSKENPQFFLLYEVYRDDAAAKSHKETAHYQEWKDKVASMMAEPRRGEQFQALGGIT
ncbi:MAG: antibiotic biosynthesis monooxygenase [Chthoniobacterales bacterium]|nr:antibiotic biosynthesis monooxygenase [Chthoniobacterales bacterium]MCX7712980.1 antibiotic biosynthesis monooxygenase [Chthoniobacterales bacterium]